MWAGISTDERLRCNSVASDGDRQRHLANGLRVQHLDDSLAQRRTAFKRSSTVKQLCNVNIYGDPKTENAF